MPFTVAQSHPKEKWEKNMENLWVWGMCSSKRMSELTYTSLHSVCVRRVRQRYFCSSVLKRIPSVTLSNCKAQSYTAGVWGKKVVQVWDTGGCHLCVCDNLTASSTW